MRERLGNALHALLVIAAAALLAFLSTRYRVEADWSQSQAASLGESSQALLASLDGPVEVVSYARPAGGLRAAVADFIERYRRVKPDLALRFVDPDADPAAMREAGIGVDGEMEIRYRGRSERVTTLGEAAFSSALLRLSRPHERLVAFLEGEGERQPLGKANADLGQFVGALASRGLRAVPLPLAHTGQVPANTDLVVVADPQVALPAAVSAALVDYLDGGGALLWLAEPARDAGLEPLAAALGIRVLAGTVVDGSGQAFGLGDPSFVAVSSYPPHAVTKDFALTTLFPQPAALARIEGAHWAAQSILRSSASSWNETGSIAQAGKTGEPIRQDAAEGEIAGPLDLGLALTRVSPRPDRREQRVVVLGDGDFLSNSFLGNGGNREFGQRVFDWLLGDEAQVAVADARAPDRELALSQVELAVLGLGFLLAGPLLLAATGGWIWWRRRRRP